MYIHFRKLLCDKNLLAFLLARGKLCGFIRLVEICKEHKNGSGNGRYCAMSPNEKLIL